MTSSQKQCIISNFPHVHFEQATIGNVPLASTSGFVTDIPNVCSGGGSTRALVVFFFFFLQLILPFLHIHCRWKKLSLASFQLPAQGILLTSCLRAGDSTTEWGCIFFSILECMDLFCVFRNSLQSEQPQLLGWSDLKWIKYVWVFRYPVQVPQ